MASHPASTRIPAYRETLREEPDSNALLKVFVMILGIAVGAVIPLGIWLAASAQHATHEAQVAAAKAAGGDPSASRMPGMAGTSAQSGSYATPSFAGIAPTDADALAMRHAAYPAMLPAAPVGPVAHVRLTIQHRVVSIAPGIRYDAWTFGDSAPGPTIHVRQGQKVDVTLVNDAPMAHSVDFHAAQIAPNRAFGDVMPGKSKSFSFVASTPGVFMYHCGTAPAFMHIANGMYGAIVVEPKDLPPAQKQYVLVSSEWYLNSSGLKTPASLDLTKADQMTPDWVTWNGYAAQYKTHPLTAMPGDTVRFWVVDAGPRASTPTSTSSAPFSGEPGSIRTWSTSRSTTSRPPSCPRAEAACSTSASRSGASTPSSRTASQA